MNRREIVAIFLGIGTVGCLGRGGQEPGTAPESPTPTQAPTSTKTQIESTATGTSQPFTCGDKEKDQSPTSEAIEIYGELKEDLGRLSLTIGDLRQFESRSIMGSSGIYYLTCPEHSSDCEVEYLTAIEKFRDVREDGREVKRNFNILAEYVDECSANSPDLFKENSHKGVNKAELYIKAADNFIKSAKRHVDEGLSHFQMGEEAERGIANLRSAREVDIISSDLLEKRINVYSG